MIQNYNGNIKESLCMFKKIIGATLALSLVLGGTSVFAAPGKDLRIVPIIVNGHKVKFPDTEPYIDMNGRTMVPVRFVSEKLGGKVGWDAKTRIVTITYKGKNIKLPVGSKTVSIDETQMELDTAAEMYEGRTMVPLRFVSEAMESTVTFDKGAHSVLVSDAAFLSKVEAGTIKLDPWGRQLSGEASSYWNKLSDLPASFYNVKITDSYDSSKEYFARGSSFTEKQYIDEWAEHARQYYITMLNINYKTLNADTFAESLVSNMEDRGSYFKSETVAGFKEFAAWAKTNKLITKGYADPESVRSVIRTYFKFMIVSATDTSQTFMDNYDVSASSDSYKLKLGVWYGGYSDVHLDSNAGNKYWTKLSMSSTESMFSKGRYSYSILE
jgi:hypothetical protein